MVIRPTHLPIFVPNCSHCSRFVGHSEVIGLKGYLLREKTLQVRPAARIAIHDSGTL